MYEDCLATASGFAVYVHDTLECLNAKILIVLKLEGADHPKQEQTEPTRQSAMNKEDNENDRDDEDNNTLYIRIMDDALDPGRFFNIMGLAVFL